MHKQRLNELDLYVLMEPTGPLLIKSGRESGADPTLPNMNFVRTLHPRTGERTIYLPGSSLKGAIRSHVERIVRTVHGSDPHICCDPLDRQQACGNRIDKRNNQRKDEERLDTIQEYNELCLACRIFGHTAHAGHFTASDAYPREPIDTLPVRQGVGINRFSGGAQRGALFEIEVVQGGQFQGHFRLVNYELWQVGLLALTLRDLAFGRLPLGFGKSRGLGEMTMTFQYLEISYPGRFDEGDFTSAWYGLSALNPALLAEKYSLQPNDRLPLLTPGKLDPGSTGWGRPSVQFGFHPDEKTWYEPDAEAVSARQRIANGEIMNALAAAVPAWANLKPESRHA